MQTPSQNDDEQQAGGGSGAAACSPAIPDILERLKKAAADARNASRCDNITATEHKWFRGKSAAFREAAAIVLQCQENDEKLTDSRRE